MQVAYGVTFDFHKATVSGGAGPTVNKFVKNKVTWSNGWFFSPCDCNKMNIDCPGRNI